MPIFADDMRANVEAPGPGRCHNRPEVNCEARSVSTTPPVNPNIQESKPYLLALDPTTDSFTFQTFDEVKGRRDRRLARIIHGSLATHAAELSNLNARGAGVFVAVNGTDLKGRGTRHVTRIRGIWQDDDNGWQGEFPLPPSLVVSTSSGRFQRLWLCNDLTINQHHAVQQRLARSYGHDPQASDGSRVLRLPGFRHMKKPLVPYFVQLVGGNRRRYNADEILSAFRPIERPPARTWCPRSDDDQRVRDALMSIPPESMDRWKWVQIGMALKNHFGDSGLELWDAWSRQSELYDRKGLERAWRSFRGSGVTIATVFHHAREHSRVA